jgi:predicted  nucleic acid-binding Zn-ribbon protein
MQFTTASDRIVALEEDVVTLRNELNELRQQFLDFKKQLE